MIVLIAVVSFLAGVLAGGLVAIFGVPLFVAWWQAWSDRRNPYRETPELYSEPGDNT